MPDIPPEPAPRRGRTRLPSAARRVLASSRRRRSAERVRPAQAERLAPTRLRAALWQPGRGQIIAAVILFVVGLGAVTQLRISNADDAYTNSRREDLIQILDGLGAESRRLEAEIAELEQTRSELRSGADRQQVARTETERRLSQLAILAGTAPATGPGIRLRISDPAAKVTGDVLLDAVEEMRDAGAEVIEVNDLHRVVASTWFGGRDSALTVDGRTIARPITIEVIGDPHSLEEAASFRGGLVSEITGPRIGGRVDIEQIPRLRIDSLHTAPGNQYARPASPPPSPR